MERLSKWTSFSTKFLEIRIACEIKLKKPRFSLMLGEKLLAKNQLSDSFGFDENLTIVVTVISIIEKIKKITVHGLRP